MRNQVMSGRMRSHDAVEDTDTSFDEIADRFGPVVDGLVREMTDDKSLPKERRKELQIVHAPSASPGAKQLKIADKIANVRDVSANSATGWPLIRTILLS